MTDSPDSEKDTVFKGVISEVDGFFVLELPEELVNLLDLKEGDDAIIRVIGPKSFVIDFNMVSFSRDLSIKQAIREDIIWGLYRE